VQARSLEDVDGALHGGAEPPGRTADQASLVQILGRLYERRVLIVGVTGIGIVLSVFATFLPWHDYTARTVIVPTSSLSSSGDLSTFSALRGAAMELGLGGGGAGTSITPLLPDLLSSRDLMVKLLARKYPTRKGTEVDLMQYLGATQKDPQRALQIGVMGLRGLMVCTTDKKSGSTTLTVTLDDPVIAAAVANAGVEELGRFLRELKIAQAGQKVRFISQRLNEVETALRDAEDSQRISRERNRLTSGSPALLLEQARIARSVSMNEQVFITLKTQLELAQIEAVRDVPDIAVVEKAVPPLYERRLRRVVLNSAFFFGFLAVAIVLSLPYVAEFKRVIARRA